MDVNEEKSDNDEMMDGETSQAHSIKSGNAGGKSEYSRIRDANIAENKSFFLSWGCCLFWATKKTKGLRKKGRKGRRQL